MVDDHQTVVDVDRLSVKRAVADLLEWAGVANGDRRTGVRVPFYGPVNLTVEESGLRRTYSVISRDISSNGMGLLHIMPLSLGPILLTWHRRDDESLRLRGEIVWCEPCGAGWYLSGVKFHAAE